VVLLAGRRREDLESWFGTIEGLCLVAENGAILRLASSNLWEPLRPYPQPDWKSHVRPILEHFVDRTPGSFVEEKEYSLVWHYRMADPEFGEWLANELAAMLEGMLAETELRALRGRKMVEVKPLWINKGEVCGRLKPDWEGATFCFAAGADHTDEELFEALGPQAWTVRVGSGRTLARFTLPDAAAVGSLLRSFAAGAAVCAEV
jgi:trehalose 6-phosphate synthase/phosphatase